MDSQSPERIGGIFKLMNSGNASRKSKNDCVSPREYRAVLDCTLELAATNLGREETNEGNGA